MTDKPRNLSHLEPAKYNPRTISDEALAGLKASLREFGDLSGIVYNQKTGNLICAHQRRKVLLDMDPMDIQWGEPYLTDRGLEADGWVMLLDGSRYRVRRVDWDLRKEKAANITANSTTITGRFTADLPDLVQEVFGDGDDLYGRLYDNLLMDDLLAQLQEDLAKLDKKTVIRDPVTPELPSEPIAQPGDVWVLGDHRVVCGDCSDPAVVKTLMGDSRAAMLFTDPPYGVDYQEKNVSMNRRLGRPLENLVNKPIQGDTIKNVVDLWKRAFLTVSKVIQPGGAVYVTYAGSPDLQVDLHLALRAAKLSIRQVLTWYKSKLVPSRMDYNGQTEHILYGWLLGAAHRFYGPTNACNVWHHKRPDRSKDHPTQKPVSLVAQAVRDGSRRGEIVIDTFLGSGPTVLAAEQLQRSCYGIEIEPRYVDVTVKRWEDLTGQKARRLT